MKSITLQQIKDKGTFDFSTATWTASGTDRSFTLDDLDDPTTLDAPTNLDNSLLLMPQTLASGAQIVVEYKIQAANNGAWLHGSDSEWATKTIALTGDWETGRNYTYTLTADHDIQLGRVSITDWDNGDSTELENNGTTTLQQP